MDKKLAARIMMHMIYKLFSFRNFQYSLFVHGYPCFKVNRYSVGNVHTFLVLFPGRYKRSRVAWFLHARLTTGSLGACTAPAYPSGFVTQAGALSFSDFVIFLLPLFSISD